ncbi:intraflagellar transport protein 43 homolog isoform X2 [Chelonus insularis]|uniref:intraflagellar transport protein 43 homolog isoform X2 n=1 Tax=Chelonus insularis TaxID=460826 RepID=UPI001588F918|nr:intraflagellar transport protein 43 homolog isoform X2 [Chelonus insularis]
MDWVSDLEISSKKQLIPRLGRRATQSNIQEDQKFEDEPESPVSFPSSGSIPSSAAPVAPPRTRKAGWSDEHKINKTKSANLIEHEKNRKSNRNDIEDDIPIIPDIEEIQEESGFSPIETAISAGINRVTAFKDLDTDLIKNASFAFLDGVNLSLLTEKLYPEKLLDEPDEVWTWDSLFTQVSSELNSESQKTMKETR